MIKAIEEIPGIINISMREAIRKDIEGAILANTTIFEVTGYNTKYLAEKVRQARDDITYKKIREAGGTYYLMSQYPYVKDWLIVRGRTIDGVKRVFCEMDYPKLEENIKQALTERAITEARYREKRGERNK